MFRFVVAALVAVLALAACKKILNKDDDSFHTRMVNLIEDSASVQYKIETTIVASSAYQAISPLNGARPGSHSVSFQALRPPSLVINDTTDPIDLGGTFSQDYAKDTDYTIFAYGKLDDVKAVVIEEPSKQDGVPEDNIELKVVNVDASAPALTVYVTAPEAHIDAPQSLGTLTFGQKTDARTMQLFQRADVTDSTAALFTDLTFELRDPAGTLLFTSAPVRVTEQTRLVFAITHNTGPGPSTVQMLGVDGVSGVFTNKDDQAAVRFLNVSADSPPIDIIRGSSLETPLAQNIAFRDRSPYVNVPVGDVDLIGTPHGSTGLTFLFLEEFQALQGASYSAYAVGPFATVDAQVLTDSRRSVPTQASFRFLNAASSFDGDDGLDVYVTVPGLTLDFDSTDDTDTTDDAAQFKRASAWTFHSASDYTILKPSTYQVRFMATGTSRVVLDTTITVPAGGVQTYVLNDDPEAGGLDLMPIDDTQ